MSTTRLRWEGGQRWTGTDSWGMVVAIDGDQDSATGAKPSDLVPISLAACIGYTLVQVLLKQRQSFIALEASIDVEQEADPPWAFTRIDCHFVITGEVDQARAHKAMMLAHEKYCAVSASLTSTAMDHTIEVVAPS